MRIVGVARHVLPILATLQALAATAQTAHKPVAKPDDDVVVARNNRDPGTQIRDFVQIMTPTLGNEPLPRFDLEQLCPRALGLAPEFDEAIKLDKEQGPVVAWHLKRLVTQDGVPLLSDDRGRLTSRTANQPSRLRSLVRPALLMSVVIIERRGEQGLTVTQIADYAAMPAFADANPARAGKTTAPTILTVLEAPMGSETPLSMAGWNLGLLRGLYASPPNSLANAQRGAISRSMKREIDTSGGD